MNIPGTPPETIDDATPHLPPKPGLAGVGTETQAAVAAPVFRNLIEELSERLGHDYLPCRCDAHDLCDFLAPDGVHAELGNTIITTIYKASRCAHLNAPVRVMPVFEALGQLRGRLVQSSTTDVEQIAFLERVGMHLREVLETAAGDDLEDSPPAPVNGNDGGNGATE